MNLGKPALKLQQNLCSQAHPHAKFFQAKFLLTA